MKWYQYLSLGICSIACHYILEYFDKTDPLGILLLFGGTAIGFGMSEIFEKSSITYNMYVNEITDDVVEFLKKRIEAVEIDNRVMQ